MESNDNSSRRRRRSSQSLSHTAASEEARETEATESKRIKPNDTIFCLFCCKKIKSNSDLLFDRPELLVTLNQLEVHVSQVDGLCDYICYQCDFKIRCVQDYQCIWKSNISKSRIYFYYRKGDKEMVRRLIASKTKSTATATADTTRPDDHHHSAPRTRSGCNNAFVDSNTTIAAKEAQKILNNTNDIIDSQQNDCVPNADSGAKPNEIFRTDTETGGEDNSSDIRISSVNTLHCSSTFNETEKKQTSPVQPHRRTVSLIETATHHTEKTNMPRRSSIVNSETATDLNRTNISSSGFLENGYLHESSRLDGGGSMLEFRKQPNSQQHSEKPVTQSVLNIMYEENEPAVVTESGGEVSSRRSATPYGESRPMKCKYCDRIYKRLTFLIKHEKKHERSSQKAATIISSRANSAKSVAINLYNCDECDETFATKFKLNKHSRQHMTEFCCQYCLKEFILKVDVDFHEAICFGEMQAKKSMQNDDADAETENRSKRRSTRYFTRSTKSTKINYAGTRNNNGYNYDGEMSETTEIDSLFSSRMRNTKKWTNQVLEMQNNCDEEEEEEEEDNAYTGVHIAPIDRRQSFMTEAITEISFGDWQSSPMKRNESIELNYHQNNLAYAPDIRKGTSSIESYNDEAIFLIIKCQNCDCQYQNLKLENVIKHDAKAHGVPPLFYCKKCKGSFSRKYYYDIHCLNQDPGVFICYKCGGEFMYTEMLNAHLEEHEAREMGNGQDEIPCHYCRLKFLCNEDFMVHLASPNHLKFKAQRRIIFKVRNSYPILTQQKENNNTYNSCNNNTDCGNSDGATPLSDEPVTVNDSMQAKENKSIDLVESIKQKSQPTAAARSSLATRGAAAATTTTTGTQPYVSYTKIIKVKKFESKLFKYECNCVRKKCYNCQKHRKMIPIYGREPRPTKNYAHRSCHEVRLPLWNTTIVNS